MEPILESPSVLGTAHRQVGPREVPLFPGLYIPPTAQLVPTEAKRMVALIGETGTGKTHSAVTTFPNPLVLDFDDNLQKYAGKVNRVPFCSEEFMKANYKDLRTPRETAPQNRKDALMKWIRTEGVKMQANQTLVLDSWTTVQDAFDQQTSLTPAINKATGQEDGYAFWAEKIEWSTLLCTTLKSLKCHVVVTLHETFKKSKKAGEILDEMAVLMDGKFVTRMGLYFSDWIYCLVLPQLDPATKKPMTEADGRTPKIQYVWQVRSDTTRKCKTRMSVNQMFVEPSYEVFAKYA